MTTAGMIAVAAVTGWEQRRAEWVDVAWLAMRVHVGRMQDGGGGLMSLTLSGRRMPPRRPPRQEAKTSPPQADTGPPPSKAPRTGSPGERAAHNRTRGVVDEWVEQQ